MSLAILRLSCFQRWSWLFGSTVFFVLQDDYEDASDDDNLSEEQSQQQAIENQKFQEQQSLLEQKEDQLIRHVLGRFEDEKAEPIRSLSQIRGVLEMKHFKSPHLYIAERVDKSMFDENKR